MQIRRQGTTKRRDEGRAGGALIVVLLVMASLATMGAAFVTISSGSRARISSAMDERRAFQVAEAGIREAAYALQAGGTGNVGSAAAPAALGDGLFWVEATPVDAEVALLRSTAMVGSGRSALEVTVRIRSSGSPLFFATLNSKEALTLNADVVIDSYDSNDGTYASHAMTTMGSATYANTNGHVASNAGIILNAHAMNFGNATPGPGHGVSFATDSYVHGSVTPALESSSFPEIEVPPTPSSGDLSLSSGSVVTLPSGDVAYGNLTIGKGATLTVTGPAEIVVDNFTGGKDANLVVDATNGPVTFVVKSGYTHTTGFEATPAPGSPMAVAFMLKGTQDIIFPSGTKVRGAYYAPDANITFTSANEAWGSFAGNKVSMSNAMNFHYDESLSAHWKHEDKDDAGDPVEVIAWFETSVMPPSLRSKRKDPLELLGLTAADLRTPADAWEPAP
jgi:hypothetical protein